jgi:hypothetical protein
VVAPARPQAELVRVEGMVEADTLQGKCDAVIAAVGRGEVSADAGRAPLQLLDLYGHAIEVDVQVRRMAPDRGRARPQGRGRLLSGQGGLFGSYIHGRRAA